MKKQGVDTVKRVMKAIIIILLACVLAGCTLFYSDIKGHMSGYENDGHPTDYTVSRILDHEYEDFNMSHETALDIQKNPSKYTEYWIGVYIHNLSPGKIHGVEGDLAADYDNLWFDRTSFYEWTLDMEANAAVKDKKIRFLVKTEGMSEQDIDRLIRNIQLKISWDTYRFPVARGGSKTISYEH